MFHSITSICNQCFIQSQRALHQVQPTTGERAFDLFHLLMRMICWHQFCFYLKVEAWCDSFAGIIISIFNVCFYLKVEGLGTVRPTRCALERTRSIWVTPAVVGWGMCDVWRVACDEGCVTCDA